jgi:hypothetical protein
LLLRTRFKIVSNDEMNNDTHSVFLVNDSR